MAPVSGIFPKPLLLKIHRGKAAAQHSNLVDRSVDYVVILYIHSGGFFTLKGADGMEMKSGCLLVSYAYIYFIKITSCANKEK